MALEEIVAGLKRRHMQWSLDFRPGRGSYRAEVQDIHGIHAGVVANDAALALSGALQMYEECIEKEQADRERGGLDPLPLFR